MFTHILFYDLCNFSHYHTLTHLHLHLHKYAAYIHQTLQLLLNIKKCMLLFFYVLYAGTYILDFSLNNQYE